MGSFADHGRPAPAEVHVMTRIRQAILTMVPVLAAAIGLGHRWF
jgi:hypothetical protein